MHVSTHILYMSIYVNAVGCGCIDVYVIHGQNCCTYIAMMSVRISLVHKIAKISCINDVRVFWTNYIYKCKRISFVLTDLCMYNMLKRRQTSFFMIAQCTYIHTNTCARQHIYTTFVVLYNWSPTTSRYMCSTVVK